MLTFGLAVNGLTCLGLMVLVMYVVAYRCGHDDSMRRVGVVVAGLLSVSVLAAAAALSRVVS